MKRPVTRIAFFLALPLAVLRGGIARRPAQRRGRSRHRPGPGPDPEARSPPPRGPAGSLRLAWIFRVRAGLRPEPDRAPAAPPRATARPPTASPARRGGGRHCEPRAGGSVRATRRSRGAARRPGAPPVRPPPPGAQARRSVRAARRAGDADPSAGSGLADVPRRAGPCSRSSGSTAGLLFDRDGEKPDRRAAGRARTATPRDFGSI